MVEKQEILTQEGYNKIEEEVEYLKTVKRKEVHRWNGNDCRPRRLRQLRLRHPGFRAFHGRQRLRLQCGGVETPDRQTFGAPDV